jgi:hypothetical protein
MSNNAYPTSILTIQDILDFKNRCNEVKEYSPEEEAELRKIREDSVARDLKILKMLEVKE